MTASEPRLTREERTEITGKIKSLVLAKHVNVANPSQDYGPWTQEFDRRLDEVVAAPSRNAFENGLGSILQGLGSSHTAFYHKIGDRIPPQHAINASLRPMEINGNQHWVFLNIIEDGPAHRAGVKAGDVLYSCDGKLAEPPHSPRFQLGGTHELQLGEIEGSGTRSVKVEVPNRAAKDRPPMIEPKSITYRVAAPGIGMIRVASFPGAVGLSFARALDSAIAALARESCSRLIIDLRGNLGGGLGSLRLMSYLCPGKVPIGYSMSRTGIKRGWSKERLPSTTVL